MRAELGRRLALRYLPELTFMKDTSGPRANRVLELLDSLHRDDAHHAVGEPPYEIPTHDDDHHE